MPPETPAQRKAKERMLKREQGLVLKQLWVPPAAWAIISDLATDQIESLIHNVTMDGGSYSESPNYEDGVSVSYTYEYAQELTNEILAYGELRYGKDQASKFLMRVIRAMLKTYRPERLAPEFEVSAIREQSE